MEDLKIRLNPITDVHARIEKSLHLRTAPSGTARARLEELVKRNGAVLWRQLKKRPSLGVVLVGGTGIALASLVGVGELTVGLVAGYAAYLILREGMAPREVAEQVFDKVR